MISIHPITVPIIIGTSLIAVEEVGKFMIDASNSLSDSYAATVYTPRQQQQREAQKHSVQLCQCEYHGRQVETETGATQRLVFSDHTERIYSLDQCGGCVCGTMCARVWISVVGVCVVPCVHVSGSEWWVCVGYHVCKCLDQCGGCVWGTMCASVWISVVGVCGGV